MCLVEGKEQRYNHLTWWKQSHQMCTNHEPSSNECKWKHTSCDLESCSTVTPLFLIRVYRTEISCIIISWIFFVVCFFSLVVLEYFAFGSSIYFEFDLHLFLICYLVMKLWLQDMTILFLFLHCSLFSSGFQKGAGKMQWLYVLLQ